MMMPSKNLTFHINNLAYSINVDSSLEQDLCKYLGKDKNNSTKELLAAYIRMTQEFNEFKDEVKKLSDKLPND